MTTAQIQIKRVNLVEALRLFDKCYLKAKKSADSDFAESGIAFVLANIGKGTKARMALQIMSTDTTKTAWFCFEDGENYEVFELLKGSITPIVFLAKGEEISQLIKALKAIDDDYCTLFLPEENVPMRVESSTIKFEIARVEANASSVINTVDAATQKSPFDFEIILNRKQLKELLSSNDSTLVKIQIPDNQQLKVDSQASEINGIIKIIHSGGGYQPKKMNTLGTV